jgi:Secretion system C-terminal sorting domain
MTLSYTLFDILGKKVLNSDESKFKSGEVKEDISLEGLSKGVYLLNIKINEKETSIKIVKE